MSALPRPPLPALAVAAALACGSAVSLGLARFAYGLMLPPMRADLGWSYFVAGAMNTVNAAGYLAGALAAAACLRRFGAGRVLIASTGATALTLAAHGAVESDAALYALRAASGFTGALSLVAGAVLATRIAVVSGAAIGAEEAGTAAAITARWWAAPSAGLVLGLYYGGAGIGIVAAAVLVPLLTGGPDAHAWQPAWLGIGALAMLATGVIVAAVSRFADIPPPNRAGDPGPGSLAWRDFMPALIAYLLFGLGYIGYMTFVVTLLREQRLGSVVITAFFAMLGLAVIASPWLWARTLQRFRGGESLAILNALLVVATLLPVLSARPMAVFASGLLFGAVFLSLVTSTTALVRHNLPPALWAAGIAGFTVVFAVGQIIGPALIGLIADRHGGLRAGLACSAAVLALAAIAASRQRSLPP